MEASSLSPASLAPSTRELIELVFERLDAGTGPWTLEMRAVDGRLEKVFRHETIFATALGRFDREPPDLTNSR